MRSAVQMSFLWALVPLLAVSRGAESWPQARVSHSASTEVQALLQRAERLVADEEWEQGVNAIRRVMDSFGDQRIGLGESDPRSRAPRQFITVRQFCQLRLVAWSRRAPQALAAYRRQVDPVATQRLTRALANHDPAGLEEVVRRFLVSSSGDQALWHLGEWALEQGDYNRARSAWERLHRSLRHRSPGSDTGTSGPLWLALRGPQPGAPGPGDPPVTRPRPDGGWPLSYPDTDIPLSDIRARLTLVSILEGSTARAAAEQTLFAKLHPQSEGQLAGQQGRLADLLDDLLNQSRRWAPPQTDTGWAAFGGDQRRGRVASQALDLQRRPAWTVGLAPRSSKGAPVGPLQPVCHPVVIGETVVVSDGQHVRALDLETGRPAFASDTAQDGQLPDLIYQPHRTVTADHSSPSLGLAPYTLMAHGKYLFARLESAPETGEARAEALRSESHLVGLDLAAEGRLARGFPLLPPEHGWSWDGVPVCDGLRLHVAIRRYTDSQVEAAIVRYDLTTARPLGPPLRIASAVRLESPARKPQTHNLLSLAEDTILCNTNLGAIAAYDTKRGVLKWLFQYPRTRPSQATDSPRPAHLDRHLNPCLIYKDLAIVAPLDSDRMVALDITTGQSIWSVLLDDGIDLVHLLGVCGERLIASGDGVYAFDLYSGKLVARFPSATETAVHGYGRGVLAADRVYWPLRTALYVLDARTLALVRQPFDLAQMDVQGGNLVLVDRTLLIAGARRLVALRGSPVEKPQRSIPQTRETSSTRFPPVDRF